MVEQMHDDGRGASVGLCLDGAGTWAAPFPLNVSVVLRDALAAVMPRRLDGFVTRLFAIARVPRDTTLSSTKADELAPDRAARAGDPATFQRLVVPQLDAAYNFARFLSRDAEAAQDIVQDAFLRAYRAFGTFQGASVKAWLFAIVRNCHHDWLLERRRTARVEIDPGLGADADEPGADLENVASDEDTPEMTLIRKTESERVRGVLLRLRPESREILVLRELEELSYRDIAEVAGLPIGTVMSRLARARREFAQEWSMNEPSGETAP